MCKAHTCFNINRTIYSPLQWITVWGNKKTTIINSQKLGNRWHLLTAMFPQFHISSFQSVFSKYCAVTFQATLVVLALRRSVPPFNAAWSTLTTTRWSEIRVWCFWSKFVVFSGKCELIWLIALAAPLEKKRYQCCKQRMKMTKKNPRKINDVYELVLIHLSSSNRHFTIP